MVRDLAPCSARLCAGDISPVSVHDGHMLTNDILRRVRYALDLNDAKVTELFALTGFELKPNQTETMFSKEDDDNFVRTGDALAHRFFSGLILSRRGKQEGQPPAPVRTDTLTGNDVLWYIRIAMQYRDDDVVSILRKAGVEISKSELGAFFRKKGHPNYRVCGDQLLRNFLAGFTAHCRGDC